MQALDDQPSDDEILNIENTAYLPDDMKYKFPNKKSCASLHSIQSPSTTYLHMEEEHRKHTEAQLSQNIENDIDIHNNSLLQPTVNKHEDSEHELIKEPSSIDLSQQNFVLTDSKLVKVMTETLALQN